MIYASLPRGLDLNESNEKFTIPNDFVLETTLPPNATANQIPGVPRFNVPFVAPYHNRPGLQLPSR